MSQSFNNRVYILSKEMMISIVGLQGQYVVFFKAMLTAPCRVDPEHQHNPGLGYLVNVLVTHREGEGEPQGQFLVLHVMFVQEVRDALSNVIEKLGGKR